MTDEGDCPVIRIPLVDLSAQHRGIKEDLEAAVRECVDRSSFIGGEDHDEFALEFSEFCGGGHTALCGSGTDALYLSLMGLLGPGDGRGEVITVSHTFIATAEAVSLAGYRPVFVDIDPETYLMDTDKVEEAITDRTKAVIPVHLYGQMVPMDKLMSIARRHRLHVLEDAAQAHGARWMNKGPGQWGDAACFSFYPGKNLGAWGDGGAVFSRDRTFIEGVRMRANHGRSDKYTHRFAGINSRMDGLQAAVLRVKLRHLERWNEKRLQAARLYDSLLKEGDGLTLPMVRDQADHVFHLFVVRVKDRDRVFARLREEGIGAGIHYPIAVHEQPAYSHLRPPPETLAVTHNTVRSIISLPLYPEITDDHLHLVAGAVRRLAAS